MFHIRAKDDEAGVRVGEENWGGSGAEKWRGKREFEQMKE